MLLYYDLAVNLAGIEWQVAVWMWKVFHKLMCLNTWSPIHTVLEGCGTFRKYSPSGGSRLQALNFYSLVSFPVSFLLRDCRYSWSTCVSFRLLCLPLHAGFRTFLSTSDCISSSPVSQNQPLLPKMASYRASELLTLQSALTAVWTCCPASSARLLSALTPLQWLLLALQPRHHNGSLDSSPRSTPLFHLD